MQLTRSQTGNGQQALTIFAVPKAFHARFKVIQTNAIRSWTLLRPEPEIILLGDDEGTAQIARELGCSHIADVERNRYGTPLVHSIFEKAQELARNDLVCYVNSDIILMSDFIVAVSRAAQVLAGRGFLLVGRKRTCAIDELLDFEKADWEIELKDLVRTHGRCVTYDSDFFDVSRHPSVRHRPLLLDPVADA